METIGEMTDRFPRAGRLEWIGVSRERREQIESWTEAEIRAGTGIEGEHHAKSGRSKRQVTLIQSEHLPVLASLVGRNELKPELLRRNLAVSGINLLALKEKRFRIGDVLLEGTGICAPCSQMEKNLGAGGYNAMRGHGGITARVLEGGTIRLGDAVEAIAGDGEE